MRRFKPLFRYAGNKAKLLTTYAPFFEGLHPQHCVDYFGGSGTMSLWFHQLYPDAKLYLNEKDSAIYKLFKCIQQEYEEFIYWLGYIATWCRNWTDNDMESKKEFYYLMRREHYNPTQDVPDEWFQADYEKHPEDYEEVDADDVALLRSLNAKDRKRTRL